MSLVTDSNRRWWTLGIVTVSLFMETLDATIVNVALPSIQKDLGSKLSQLEWTVNAFNLTYAALLLPCGKAADFFGRRRILVLGLFVFTSSSLVCALSTSGAMLISARSVQGLGAALMMPATHSLISANFSEEEHGLAYGIWAGVSMLGLSLGPLIGGVLVQKLDWPWIFYVNVPLGAIMLVVARIVIRESKDKSTNQGLDPAGIVVSSLALFALVFALIEAHGRGWGSTLIVACFAGAAVGFVLFGALEKWQRRPMLDLSLFRNGTFTGSNVVTLLSMLPMFGVLFFASIYLQEVHGYSAIQTGATFLPLTLIFMAISPLAGLLGDRVGFRWPVTAGMALLGIGLVLFSRIGAHSTFWDMLPALVIGGFGLGVSTAPVTAAAMVSTPVDKAGVGAGVLVTFRQTGGALGVGIMGAIVGSQVGHLSPGQKGFSAAFVTGFSHALLVAGGIAFAGALVAVALIRGTGHVTPLATVKDTVARSFAVATLGGIPAPTAVRNVVGDEETFAALALAPALIALDGPLAGTRFPIVEEVSIGRRGAGLSIDDGEVSRRHATVRRFDGTLEISDLDSLNGTFVNDVRIDAPRRLREGDVVRVGLTSLEVETPVPPAATAALVVDDGSLAGQRIVVDSALTLGRERVDVVFDDPKVSRRHAIVRPVDGTFQIADTGSVNGTFVNGERIEGPKRLADGDLVRLGDTTVQVEAHAEPSRAPMTVAATVRVPAATIVSATAPEPLPAPALVVEDGPLAGSRFAIKEQVSLGRASADITIDDGEVSRLHAVARPVEDTLEIADAGSVNGTFVNGERIEGPKRLADGDLVRVGQTALRVEVPAPSPPMGGGPSASGRTDPDPSAR